MLLKGNEAIAEAAIQAGCRLFYGYPITPSTEIPEYMSRKMREVGGTYLQAESEIAAIYMVYGAGAVGERVMTGTSSPGFSLLQEGLSYLFAAEIPSVVVNVMRGGPGLGGLGPTQGDYFQMTKGGGHGDYHAIVLAPYSVQEMINLTKEAFDLADCYRVPVIIAVDGVLGQMMEPADFPPFEGRKIEPKTWAAGSEGRPKTNVLSYYLTPELGESENTRWGQKMAKIIESEQLFVEYEMADAEYAFVSFGTSARITETAVDLLRAEGVKAGLFRPLTLWPFPAKGLAARVGQLKSVMSVELCSGQMIEDVKLTVNGKIPVGFHGRMGGMTPEPEDIVNAFKTQMLGGVQK